MNGLTILARIHRPDSAMSTSKAMRENRVRKMSAANYALRSEAAARRISGRGD